MNKPEQTRKEKVRALLTKKRVHREDIRRYFISGEKVPELPKAKENRNA